jgi:hypothetical protein
MRNVKRSGPQAIQHSRRCERTVRAVATQFGGELAAPGCGTVRQRKLAEARWDGRGLVVDRAHWPGVIRMLRYDVAVYRTSRGELGDILE